MLNEIINQIIPQKKGEKPIVSLNICASVILNSDTKISSLISVTTYKQLIK